MPQRNLMMTKIDSLALAITDRVLHWPWFTIFVWLVIVLSAGSGMRYIGFANNYRVFFGPDNPDKLAFEAFQKTYTKNDNLFFTIKPRQEAVFSPYVISAVEQFTERAWKIPYTIRVDSVTNFQHSWSKGDDLTVENLIRQGALLSQAQLDEKQQIAMAEPLLYGNLISHDGGATGINVTLQYPGKSETEVPSAVAVARRIAADFELEHPEIKVAISGYSMLNNAFGEATVADATLLIPLMYMILLIAIFLVLRSMSGTFASLLLLLFSTLIALGLAGHVGISIEPVSVTAPIVIMTIAIADSVHILMTIFTLIREGCGKVHAIREGIRANFLAIGITSLTTVIGFLSLNFSDSPPFGHLGNITACGITAAWLLSFTFLPAIISLLPIRSGRDVKRPIVSEKVMGGIGRFVASHARPVFLGSLIVALSLTAMVSKVELNDQWIEYFDTSITFRQDTEFTMDHLTGIYTVEYSVTSEGEEGVSDPQYLQHLNAFTAWLRAQPEVSHVYSYSDIIKRLNKNMHEDNEDWYRIPENRQLAAQYLFLYEISLPFGLDLNDRISLDKSATRVTVTLQNLTTVETRAFLNRSEQWLHQHTPEYMWTKPTSGSVLFSYISQRNIEGMFTGTLVALLLIAIVLALSLQSFSLGLVSLVPNLFPILITFGLWGLYVGRVGMAAATVAAISLGIVVDDTVHLLTKYLRARREYGYDQAAAIIYSLKTVGTALLATSIILSSGFAFLGLSTFMPNVELGLLTSMTIIIALVLDLFLLPALLMIVDKQLSYVEKEMPDGNELAIERSG